MQQKKTVKFSVCFFNSTFNTEPQDLLCTNQSYFQEKQFHVKEFFNRMD